MATAFGVGYADQTLTNGEVQHVCEQAFAGRDFKGKRVLVILPDLTRTAPIDLMFRTVYGLLAGKVGRLDFVIALGTHQPLSDERIDQLVGMRPGERHSKYRRSRFFNHMWDSPGQLKQIGTISEEEVAEISGGLMREAVDIRINKVIFEYDILMVIGPTFPHEVVGFSGGNKYFFPGIAGQEIINMFHWLGALITSPRIIGNKYTPVRAVVDKAASFIPMEKMCLSLVVKKGELAGLYIGSPEEAWSAASDLSDKLHIVYKDKPFRKVVAVCPTMYEDLWTGGKCMYKLEPVIADDGELLIYAPHITEVSVTHGQTIERIGYHVRDYFVQQMDRFAGVARGVMAHSTHVRGVGTYENGIERPRVDVVLASQISEERCRAINLGYRDPGKVDLREWQGREEEGILFVPKAGEMLYRLKDDPFKRN
jgi:nickel-dependent lactate racemase